MLAKAAGLKAVMLRYFNAAGADTDGETGELHEPETHIIPPRDPSRALRGKSFSVFGTDYETPDGTAVRDYMHVADLARAHVRALDFTAGHDGAHSLQPSARGGDFRCARSWPPRGTGAGARRSMSLSRRAGRAIRRLLVADTARAENVLGLHARLLGYRQYRGVRRALASLKRKRHDIPGPS